MVPGTGYRYVLPTVYLVAESGVASVIVPLFMVHPVLPCITSREATYTLLENIQFKRLPMAWHGHVILVSCGP